MDQDKKFNNFYKKLYEKYDITKDDLTGQNFKFCGSDGDSSSKGSASRHAYFKLVFREKLKTQPNWKPAPKTNTCVCKHEIAENCYLINDEGLTLIIGNCCIQKFIPEKQKSRICSQCGEPHKNRKVNRCNSCRIGLCDECDEKIEKTYKTCLDCKYGRIKYKYVESTDKIISFGKHIGETYKMIYETDKSYISFLMKQEWFREKLYIQSCEWYVK